MCSLEQDLTPCRAETATVSPDISAFVLVLLERNWEPVTAGLPWLSSASRLSPSIPLSSWVLFLHSLAEVNLTTRKERSDWKQAR